MNAKPLQTVLEWYAAHGRDLPWRKTRDAYAVLVSEIMLQQTQVSRVVAYYGRWMKRFPDWKTLAGAKPATVIKMWSGLGYNRRALMLHAAARQVAALGEPRGRAEWLKLKGIGPYTSAAMAMFANKEAHLPVDTNIRRVLGRVYLGLPFPTPAADEALAVRVEPMLPRLRKFYDVPQALFDLANAHCFKQPVCETCPLRKTCAAAPRFLSGLVKAPRRTVVKSFEKVRPGKKHPDRIYRGRILKLAQLHKNGASLRGLGAAIDPSFTPGADHEWLASMLGRLQRDGLVVVRKNKVRLP